MIPLHISSSEPRKPKIRDLAEFYNQWPALRAWAVLAASKESLSDEEREVITWLTVLADRIGDRDIAGPH